MTRATLFFIVLLMGTSGLAQSSYQPAYLQMAKEQWSEAQQLLETSASAFLAAGDSAAFIVGKQAIGVCQLRQNHFRNAIRESRLADDLASQFGATLDSVRINALLTIGESLLNLGRNADALKELPLAESMLGPDTEGAQAATCFNLLGLAYWNNQNKTLAIQYHELSIEKRKHHYGEKSVELADALNNLALVYLEDDKITAERYFRQALEIYNEKRRQTKSKRGFTLLNLASLRAELGWQDEAREIHAEASAIWTDLYGSDDHPAKAYSLIVLAKMHQLRNEISEAEFLLDKSLAQYQRIYGEKHPETANIYFLKGQMLQEQGQLKRALVAIQHAIYANYADENFKHLYDLPVATGYFNGDYLLSALMAKAKILEALHFEKTLKRRELVAALETYQRADVVLDDLRTLRVSESDKIRLGEMAHLIYQNGIQLSLTMAEQPFFYSKYKKMAFDFSERSKASLLLSAIRESEAKTFAGIPDDLLRAEDSLKHEIGYYNQLLARGFVTQENKLGLFQAEKTYRELLKQMEKNYPNYFNLKHDRVLISVSDLQAKLSPQEMMISYFEDEKDLWSFSITRNKLKIQKVPKPSQWNKLIVGYRNALYYRATNFEDSLSRILHEVLIPPKIPSKINQMIIIPDGQLHQIPFEALKNAKSQYLIEEYAVKYHYSSTLWYNTTPHADTPSEVGGGLLAVAPTYFGHHPEKLTDLPGTLLEVSNLEKIFNQNGYRTQLYTGVEATEKRMKNEDLKDYRYIHLATHGQVNTTKPALSRVFFLPDTLHDGSLYTAEIYNLKLNANLVTLSACETGLGQIATGEGILGLSRALIFAGTSNLLVSQWKVSDNSTAMLMHSFYAHALNQKGSSSYTSALRQAKIDLLQNSQFRDPYYWAAFVLIGQ